MPCFWGLVPLQEQKPLDLMFLELLRMRQGAPRGGEERPLQQRPRRTHGLHHGPGDLCASWTVLMLLPRGSLSCTLLCVLWMRNDLEPAPSLSSVSVRGESEVTLADPDRNRPDSS